MGVDPDAVTALSQPCYGVSSFSLVTSPLLKGQEQ